MSGGSLDYLYDTNISGFLDWNYIENLDLAATELIKINEIAAAKATLRLKNHLEQSLVRAEVMHEELSDVFKALEWYLSADSSEERVHEAIREMEHDM